MRNQSRKSLITAAVIAMTVAATLAAASATAAETRTTAATPAAGGDVRVLNPDVHFPEGPVWYHGKLYFVEYDRNSVDTWTPPDRNERFWSKPGCGPSAVLPTAAGEFLVTCYDNGTIGRISSTGADLPPYTHDAAGDSFVGPNDFAPDHQGGIYFTCSGTLPAMRDGAIYYLGPTGSITRVAEHVRSANGIAVSNDGKLLYAIETEEHRLIKFDVGAAGALSHRRPFLDLDALTHHVTHIYPDGVKIDAAGELYIGQNPRDPHAPLAGTIFVVDAKAKLLRRLQLPSPGVPNLAFSPDQRTLYVTALDQLDKSPYQGKLYAIPAR